MSVRNHIVRPAFNLDIAIIEGTKIMTFCGEEFVPTVTPGTSGRADVPGAPSCDRCREARDLTVEWNRLRHEKNRLVREMRALEKLHKTLMREYREKREAPEKVPVPAVTI